MAEEWKRAEVLLEAINGNVKAIAEGHSILNRKIDNLEVNLRREIKETKDSIKFVANSLKGDIREVHDSLKSVAKELGDKIDKVDRKLEVHIRMPAHSN